jgi:Nif-specific regulatory protein
MQSDDYYPLLEHQKKQIEELSLLFEIARALDRHVELRGALAPVLDLLETKAGLSRGMVTLLDRAAGELKIEEAHGLLSEEKVRGRYRLGEGIVGRVFERGSSTSPRIFQRTPGSSIGPEGAKDELVGVAYYCAPIRSGGAVMGTLSAERRLGAGRDDIVLASDRQLLEKTASLIAESAKLRERILEEQLKSASEERSYLGYNCGDGQGIARDLFRATL